VQPSVVPCPYRIGLWQNYSNVNGPAICGWSGGYNKAAVDKKTMKLIHDIEDLEPSIKDKLIFLANAIIRDAKTGKAYAH